jgi:tRNA threonylcarbamoyladenosine biosynthesis protein TsaE
MQKLIICNKLEDLDKAAEDLLDFCGDSKIFAFYGEMGAGKTTFIKKICTKLSVSENVSSPTFAIVNEYKTREEKPIYHFDFYRITNYGEAYDLGYENYFYSGNHCFIEWPENIKDLLPEETVNVHFKIEDSSRLITIQK